MKSCNLPPGSKVYSRHCLGALVGGGEVFVNKDRDRELDLGKPVQSQDGWFKTSFNTEPLLAITMKELKDFATLNCGKELLTRDDLGDLKTLKFKKQVTKGRGWFSADKSKVEKLPSEETLTELAPTLSALTDGKKDVRWAIDPMVHDPYFAELYLYSPPQPEAQEPLLIR